MAILRVKDANGNIYDIPAIRGADGNDYILTETDKIEIAEMAAELLEIPENPGSSGSDYSWHTSDTNNPHKVTAAQVGAVPASSYIDWFGRGTNIAEGTDLNAITNNGKYFCSSAAISKTLLNSPVVNDNFALYVFTRTSGASIAQMIVTLGGSIHVRGTSSDGSYRTWKTMTSTDVFTTHKDDTNNPHNVTAEQVGAVSDVQLNGASIVNENGIASIPMDEIVASVINALPSAEGGSY